MFDGEYLFKGDYADKVSQLTGKYDDTHQIFATNYDVYCLAPIVGFLYQRKGCYEKKEGQKTTKIFGDMILKNREDLFFNYRLIILLDKEHCPELEKRIDKAFRLFDSDEAKSDEELFDSYVLGGVDVIYEKLISGVKSNNDYLDRVFDFMEELNDRYFSKEITDTISDLCNLARS